MPQCQLPLIELDGQVPCLPVVPAAMLNAQLAYADSQREARKEAGAIVKSAERKAEQIIRQARKAQRQILDEAYAEFARHQQDTLAHCEKEWLARHVVSVCDDAAVERRIVQAVASRIRLAMGQVLNIWFSQQSVDDLLCTRLSRQVEQLAMTECITLQIHPEREVRMRETFGERLAIVCNPQLAPDEAVLTSSQLCVSFSLSRHFHQVVDWICAEKDVGISDQEVNPQ